MKKQPENPFPNTALLVFQGRLESWEVRYYCSFEKSWQWLRCESSRRAQAVKEAPALALRLIRESADRWTKAANDALEKERVLRGAASLIQAGLRDWGAVGDLSAGGTKEAK